MTKTLRFRTKPGWVTKPDARTEANRLIAEEIDDNFLELESQVEVLDALRVRQALSVVSRSADDDYVLSTLDAGAWVRVNRATATTVTVPSQESVPLEVGTRVWVRRVGEGSATLQPAGGVTLNAPALALALDQHCTAMLVKVGPNEWDVDVRHMQ